MERREGSVGINDRFELLDQAGKLLSRDSQDDFAGGQVDIRAGTHTAEAERGLAGLQRARDDAAGRASEGVLTTLKPVDLSQCLCYKHGLLGVENAQDDVSLQRELVEAAIDNALMRFLDDR